MSIKYEKTTHDAVREQNDLVSSPIMRFLKHQDYFKFAIGDVLVKENRWGNETNPWKVEKTAIGAPRKYMYVFENELGVGYIKQLKVDGTGFTSNLICTANFDPRNTRFVVDPDFVDHMLVGENEFEYNTEYANKKKFRQEAIAKNRSIMIKSGSVKKTVEWFYALKPGDEFWLGSSFDEFANCKYRVMNLVNTRIADMPTYVFENLMGEQIRLKGVYRSLDLKVLEHQNKYHLGGRMNMTADHFLHKKVSQQQPFPLEDVLCGPPK